MPKNTSVQKANQYAPKLSIGTHPLIARLTDSQDEFLHSHDFFEVIFNCYGEILHSINGQVYSMKVGDACIVAPNTQHSFVRTNECAHRDIMISDALFKKTCNFLNVPLYDELIKNGLLQFQISSKQISDFESLYYTLTVADDENTLQVCAKHIACHLISLLYTDLPLKSSSDPFKNKCITLIDEHYADKKIVSILLNELGYTQGHFCKKFKNAFQISPIEYINRHRIISAASTLVLTNYSVEQCCHLVGFESLPHFIKLFKEHYGLTPTKYRRAYRLSPDFDRK